MDGIINGRGAVLRAELNDREFILRLTKARHFLVCAILLIACPLFAQPKQDIPPFLKKQSPAQTVHLDGKAYRVPDFSIAPNLPGGGGPEFITQTPFGFLAIRETSKGFTFDLRRYRDVFRAAEIFRSTPNPLLVTEGLGRTPNGPVFDFTKSAPHLAFFCRLEINEEKKGIIPAKFRLGGVRYWQDDLGRRE